MQVYGSEPLHQGSGGSAFQRWNRSSGSGEGVSGGAGGDGGGGDGGGGGTTGAGGAAPPPSPQPAASNIARTAAPAPRRQPERAPKKAQTQSFAWMPGPPDPDGQRESRCWAGARSDCPIACRRRPNQTDPAFWSRPSSRGTHRRPGGTFSGENSGQVLTTAIIGRLPPGNLTGSPVQRRAHGRAVSRMQRSVAARSTAASCTASCDSTPWSR